MIVLGIESSCDETAVAILDMSKISHSADSILANCVYSQTEEHLEYGGVVPEIASRAHMEKMGVLVNEALEGASLTLDDIDGIAVTSGPGLLGGLLMGTTYAKSLSLSKNIPLIGVNHLEGHALISQLTEKTEFPYLLLLVSGGHCQFIHVKEVGDYTLVGSTLDDSIGECFDKVAKMLDLPYPGGPQIEQLAQTGVNDAFNYPTPLKNKGMDFSFSGLKTSVRRSIQKEDILTNQTKSNICASFQESVARVLEIKTGRAIEYTNSTQLVLAGGVAANRLLRTRLEKLCAKKECSFFAPPVHLCTDNALMIAYAGGLRLVAGEKTGLNLFPRPRWPLTDLTTPN